MDGGGNGRDGGNGDEMGTLGDKRGGGMTTPGDDPLMCWERGPVLTPKHGGFAQGKSVSLSCLVGVQLGCSR